MPPLRLIGDKLKGKFDGAAKVTISNDAKSLLPEEKSVKPPDSVDLVYSMDSPTYCDSDKKLGSIGTAGRRCDPNSMGVGGCDLLCCGRGYKTASVQVQETASADSNGAVRCSVRLVLLIIRSPRAYDITDSAPDLRIAY